MTLRSAENSSELADIRCSAAAKFMGTWIETADLYSWKVGANRTHQVVYIYLFLAY